MKPSDWSGRLPSGISDHREVYSYHTFHIFQHLLNVQQLICMDVVVVGQILCAR